MPIHVFKFIWSQCVCQCDVCVSAVKRIECKAEVTRVCSRAHTHTFTQLPVSHAGYDDEVESVYLNKMMKTHAPHNLPLTSWEVSVFFFFVSVRWVANSAEINNSRLLLRMHRHTMEALLCCFCWMIGMNTVRFFFPLFVSLNSFRLSNEQNNSLENTTFLSFLQFIVHLSTWVLRLPFLLTSLDIHTYCLCFCAIAALPHTNR